jgi:hypothetical protein
MAIIAGILYTLSTFFASVLMPFFLIISYRYDWEGIALGVALSIFKGLASITIMIVFMILMIHASNSMSESIGVEVTGLVFYGGLSTLMALIFNFALVFVNRYWGTSAIASFAAVNNAQSVVAPIVTASTILMVASFVTSICRKKVVIPLLYDKGYIDSDEDSQV